MIIARVPGGLRVVMQVDHQAQCGVLAARWGNTRFDRPEPWQPVLDAAGWHDEGWRQWERHPGVLSDGAPRAFTQMDLHEHVAIHRRSIAAAADREPAAAMLVAMHCAGLLQRRMGLDGPMPDPGTLHPDAAALVREEAASRAARLREMGDGATAWAWAAYRVLQAVDLLSLYLTWTGLAGGEEWTLRRVPRGLDDDPGTPIAVRRVDPLTAALDPWPFGDDRIEAAVIARVIPDRAYPDAATLQVAIRGAAPEATTFAVVPG